MSWEEKSVTLGNVDKQEFETHLAHVTVSENGIRVAFEQVDDWHRIQREVGDDMILREVSWDDVEGMEISKDHLYYPHIDVKIEPEDETDVLHERRIYFVEDEEETLRHVRNAIRKYWNAYRQRSAGDAGGYSYQEKEETPDEDVVLEEAVEEGTGTEAPEEPSAPPAGAEQAEPEQEKEPEGAEQEPEESESPSADAEEETSEDTDTAAGDTGSAKEKLKQVPDRDEDDQDADGGEAGSDDETRSDDDDAEDDEEEDGGYVDDIVEGFMGE